MFVLRKPVEFEDSWDWIYTCSCTKDQANLFNSMSQKVPLTKEGMQRNLAFRSSSLKTLRALIITIAKLYLGCAWLIPLNSLESNLTEHVRMWLTK